MKKLITFSICLFAILGFAKADNDKPISWNELPQKSLEFIKKYFPKNEVSFAKMENEIWDKTYEVVFTNGEKIEFNNKGEWKEIDCKLSSIPDALIPAAIKKHITEQFSQNKVVEIERDSKGYEIKLDNKLELKYTPTFQLKEIDD